MKLKTLIGLVLLFCVASSPTVWAKDLTVSNHESGSTVRYPVVLLRGTTGKSIDVLTIENKNARQGSGPVNPDVHDGKFKALVELSQGDNLIELSADDGSSHTLEIKYRPQTNPYYVRVVWMTDSAGDTTFATPDDSVPQDYEARLRTVAELMQTFTAERMHDRGFGRKTFRLERDEQGQVIVHTLNGPRKSEYYYELNDRVWWREVLVWMNLKHKDPYAKNMVLAAYTRKDSETGKMKAHTALGGANLGLFGSASIFSWPRSVSAARDVFLDPTVVDAKKVHDDSNSRGTIWGLAATTIGATLHEMGHTFGLPHVRDKQAIMSRGFDFFNRTFTLSEPPSGRNKKRIYHGQSKEAHFTPMHGSMLQWSHWFQLDERSGSRAKSPKIRFDKKQKEYTVGSPVGIPWIGLKTRDSYLTAYKEYKDEPLSVTLTMEEIGQLIGDKKLEEVMTIDTEGNTSNRRHK